MMDLWLLRHAEAQERAKSGRDADRELTREGRRRAQGVALGLATLRPGIGLVLTSPYLRARQTAEPVVEALGLAGSCRESPALEPERSPEEILEEIAGETASRGVLLVGHQPLLGVVLGLLVCGNRGLEIPLKKAAVARVEMEARSRGVLRALLPARVLEDLGHRE